MKVKQVGEAITLDGFKLVVYEVGKAKRLWQVQTNLKRTKKAA